MTIQWYPGHMAKAKRQILEKIKLVDIVIEIVDARIPLSSRNPMVNEIAHQKRRLILLNKSDLADSAVTKEWIEYFEEKDISVLAINAHKSADVKKVIQQAKHLMKDKHEALREKGVTPRAIRALIIGIPNVGKSSFINQLAGKNIAKTGNTPGVTKAQSWIKSGKDFELLDTPGILWPKFEDQLVGYRLAVTGAIKDTILPLQDIAAYALKYLGEHYPDRLKERYKLPAISEDMAELFDQIGRKRGCIVSGGDVDWDRVAEIVLQEIRNGKLGPLSFEIPE
ncbi:MAG TPA: ribosome biogenesis GTPase YlqF [Bacillus sp. (in: firmicutes)]|uniref:ribosome biogenesis GTPase YlqF n=1 Tax=Bacillus litorisediminis TaxID=2922713 RepID=UPI001FAE5D12|nr:ribosome biogenesis GTPase YlqF [Bacillus litorisediminis]HWO77936.1 ribosome biogenesis GTPase YlqF [Bacillus sp. (in: firmicutes)]